MRGPVRSARTRVGPADVLVIFGITGDLAQGDDVSTRCTRLERRGLLNCPIVGVAVDDWSVDDLRARARSRSSTAASQSTTKSSIASPSDFHMCPATLPMPATFERVAAAIKGTRLLSSISRSRLSSLGR
jgi:glucose-6-phosphate 1-dehydrogenase